MHRFIWIFWVGSLMMGVTCHSQDWNLEKDRNGVKVYTRKVSNSIFKEYRASVDVKTTFKKVIEMLYETKSREIWLYNTPVIEEVQKTDSTLCIYNRVDAPWPVSDRDNITCFYSIISRADYAKIGMRLMKSHPSFPEDDDVVRIQQLEGFWEITDLKNGYIRLVQQCLADPGGSLPAWLVNSSVVDSPFFSMNAIKNYLEK